MFGVGNLDNEGFFEALREKREKIMNDGSHGGEYFIANEEKKQLTLADIPKEELAMLMANLKEEIKLEMKTEAEQAAEEARLRKERLQREREKYVDAMKESDEPWMDIEAWDQDGTGAKIELDWNDAFIKHLRHNGITGADDDQVVQKWIILLMEDMTMKSEDKNEDGDFE